jgi:hypothetical protein
MIHFGCPSCAKQYRVKDEFGGRQTTCPRCKTKMTVPPPAAICVSKPKAPFFLTAATVALVLGGITTLAILATKAIEGQPEAREVAVDSRLPEARQNKPKAQPPASMAKTQELLEDGGRPRFDPNDLRRTARWALGILETAVGDADNEIQYRATVEKLEKQMVVHENAKVRWSFAVVSIGESFVSLYQGLRHDGFDPFIVTDAHGRFGLVVGEGISKEQAAKLKPGHQITVFATVTDFTLDHDSIRITLQDIRVKPAGEKNNPAGGGAQGNNANNPNFRPKRLSTRPHLKGPDIDRPKEGLTKQDIGPPGTLPPWRR